MSWRAGFFINVPIGAAMIVLAPRFLPETRRSSGRFDLTGAVSATLGVSAVIFAIIHSAEAGWTSPVTVTALVVGAMLMVVLIAGERKAQQPIMPLRLFDSRQRVGAYLGRLLYLGAMIGFFYFSTQFMQGVLGFSAFQAGVAFFPMTVVNFAVALMIPRLTPRFGQALPLAIGVVLTLLGMVWVSRVQVTSSYWDAVALPMVLIGAGQGLAFAPLTSAGIAGVPGEDAGAASGLVNTFHQLGMALGLGVLVAASANAGSGLSSPAAVLTARVSTALLTGSLLLVLCLLAVLVLVVPRVRPRRSPAAPRTTEERVPATAAVADRAVRDTTRLEKAIPCRN